MHPAFFGDPESPLYGVHHRPEPPTPGRRGAVLCQPALHESASAHRALRSLAEQLARAGVHALRFDYRGTGDSAGESADGGVEAWVADVGTAIDELKQARGLEEVGLVGLRLGATLAALLAARRDDVAFLALWEPIVEGAAYVQDLRALQRAWVDFEAEQRPAARRHATADEVLGHPLSPDFAAGLERVDLSSGPIPRARRLLLLDEGLGEQVEGLARRLEQGGLPVERRSADSGRVWTLTPDADHALVPRAVLTGIVDWIGGGPGP